MELFTNFGKKVVLPDDMKTPSYVVDEASIIHNLEILKGLRERTGCHVLLAQKAFSMFSMYPLVGEYLDGVTASGLYEARLGHEAMPGRQNHVFSPAYNAQDMDELVKICDHIVFNSMRQWEIYGKKAVAEGVSCGLRVNPEHSTQSHGIYDPCASGSRLGVRLKDIDEERLEGLSGIHFHTLCEQGADALAETLEAVEEKFGHILRKMSWINFGGGHHITRPDYDISLLEKCIRHMQDEYGMEVYLEPGEAIALNAGWLVSTVLEIQPKQQGAAVNAILDTSAACHMPDVIEMPYRPPVIGSGMPEELEYTYSFGGPTCLAGDRIGEYSFNAPLIEGDKVIFGDMAIYSMVKNNTFNGIPLPDIAILGADGVLRTVKSFGYEDFKGRLS